MRDLLSRLQSHRLNHICAINSIDLQCVIRNGLSLKKTLNDGGKILIFGCGGSAADAQHFAAELIGRFETKRSGKSVIALTTDSSILTAVGNDFGFKDIFKRQVEALVSENDSVIGISTSGSSPAIITGLAAAHGCERLLLTGSMRHEIFETISVKSNSTARIQEAHSLILHMLCAIIEA